MKSGITVTLTALYGFFVLPLGGDTNLPAAFLTIENIRNIEANVDPTREVGPILNLTRPELLEKAGPPDRIGSDTGFGGERHEALVYHRDGYEFSFMFDGQDMAGYGHRPLARFSNPQFTEENYVTSNPFFDFTPSQVTEVRFMGTASCVTGLHCRITGPAEIRRLHDLASRLGEDAADFPFCGAFTTALFFDAETNCLGMCEINADGRSIMIADGAGYADKGFLSESRELALECWDLLFQHNPNVLMDMKSGTGRCVSELLLKSFPFEELDTSNQRLEATR